MVEESLRPFRGIIMQEPPMYSALKHEGKRLYELAREGITVERPKRETAVHKLEIIKWTRPMQLYTSTAAEARMCGRWPMI